MKCKNCTNIYKLYRVYGWKHFSLIHFEINVCKTASETTLIKIWNFPTEFLNWTESTQASHKGKKMTYDRPPRLKKNNFLIKPDNNNTFIIRWLKDITLDQKGMHPGNIKMHFESICKGDKNKGIFLQRCPLSWHNTNG